MAGTIRLEGMSTAEKLLAMEAIWDDLCRHANELASPAWHEEVLAQREKALGAGQDEVEDWDVAKESIRRQLR